VTHAAPSTPASDKTAAHYAVAGIVLASELRFPGLPDTLAARPDWSLRRGEGDPPAVAVTPIGERALGAERYALGRTPSGYRLEYSHAGWFDIDLERATIVWYASGDAAEELARAIVLGPVLALALERAGVLCLHGSGVVIGGRGIVFLGGKHYGKSTLALSLVRLGAQWVSDDLIAIAPGRPPSVRPGIASARVWNDAAQRLDLSSWGTLVPGIKSTVTNFVGRTLAFGEAVLGAVYVLEPEPSAQAVHACWRVPLRGADAAIALAHHTKLSDALIGLPAAGAQLRLATAVAGSVPVWRLHVARDFARLPVALEAILEWHS
jgi:hypothetical protein